MLRRVLKGVLFALLILAVLLVVVVQLRWNRTFTAPMPGSGGAECCRWP